MICDQWKKSKDPTGREVESGGENGDGLDNANDGEPYPRIKSDRDFGKK